MTTRKELIIKKYAILEEQLKQHINVNLFPSLLEIDLSDFVYFVTLTFCRCRFRGSVSGENQRTSRIQWCRFE